MFHKDGSSTSGGKKDVPLRKSDRRRLRDRVIDSLFIGSNENEAKVATGAEWIARAEQLIDDAIIAPRGGDVLSRKLKLSSGIYATLFLRTPCLDSSATDATTTTISSSSVSPSMDETLNTGFPTAWPYYSTAQPILLEYEDEDRKVQLIPLLPLLAALPPPMLTSLPNASTSSASSSTNANVENSESKAIRQYRVPNILIHPEVSKFICRGADLMKSGMRSFPPPWKLRQSKGIVTISVIGNPQPVAIGTIEKSLFREYCYSKNANNRDWREDATNLIGPGKKGVGVTIVNCYGDDLWKSSLPSKTGSFGIHSVKGGAAAIGNPIGGGFYDDGNFGNHGFVDGKYVNPILDVMVDSDSDIEEDGDDDNSSASADMEQLKLSEPCENEGTAASDDAEIGTTDNEESNPNNHEEDQQTEHNDEENSVPDHNEILLNACYTSLLLLLSSKAPLPIPVSTYYAKNLLAAVPATGPKLDMKQTTYKKIGPFLKEIESMGVIKLGASKDGKDRCAFLTGIVKDHPELIRFKRQWKRDIEASGGDVSAMTSASASQETKLAIVDLFIVPKTVSEALQLDKDAVMAANAKTDERKGTGFLTKTECRALIENYIEAEDLVDPKTKGRVLVNGPLCDALYRTSKKNMQPGQTTELSTSVVRKDLIESWMKRMDCGHALVQMPGSKILHLKRGQPTPVDIEVEFRQGNRRKFLTRIRGMEEYGVEGESLSQDVSHRFACSATIETTPVGRPALKKGRVELVFQGHLSEELTALLSGDEKLTSHGGVKGGEYNVPKSVINVVLRKGVPAKKKR
ncbi:hypothetical protein ACHAXH_003295 [Discostella pseudostelligera]